MYVLVYFTTVNITVTLHRLQITEIMKNTHVCFQCQMSKTFIGGAVCREF